MRALLAIVLLPAIAFAQSPPSTTLERAIKLYDKQDFFSATIEAQKVIDGESGDDAAGKERAKFYLAKSLYNVRFYVPALEELQQIIDQNGAYRGGALKWIAALRDHIPAEMLAPALAAVDDRELDDPTLAQVRTALLVIKATKPHGPPAPRLGREAVSCTRADASRTRAMIAKLTESDDAVEIYEITRRALRAPDPEARALDYATDRYPATRHSRVWIAELQDELELLQRSDKAWQTTVVAAEILQEVTVQLSVAQAVLGKQLQQLFASLDADLTTLTAPPTTSGLRCVTSTPPALASGTSLPMVASPGPKQGCGCSTGDSPVGGLLVGLLLAGALRSSSRASARRRAPRASKCDRA